MEDDKFMMTDIIQNNICYGTVPDRVKMEYVKLLESMGILKRINVDDPEYDNEKHSIEFHLHRKIKSVEELEHCIRRSALELEMIVKNESN